MALSLYLLKHAMHSLKVSEASKSWPQTKGHMKKSEAVRYQSTSSRWNFTADYEYSVEGKVFQGHTVALYTIIHKEEAQALAERYPSNKDITVYYNPEAPEESVLIPGSREGKKYGEVIFAVVAVLASIVFAISGYLGLIGK